MSAAALDELGDGSELILCGCRGDVAGVEQETEEGGLSGTLPGDHERVPSVGRGHSGTHAVGDGTGCRGREWGMGVGVGVGVRVRIVGEHSGDGRERRRASAMVVAVDGERHDRSRREKSWH